VSFFYVSNSLNQTKQQLYLQGTYLVGWDKFRTVKKLEREFCAKVWKMANRMILSNGRFFVGHDVFWVLRNIQVKFVFQQNM
jgi:hypothetical protein